NHQFVANFDVNYTPVSSAYPAATPSTVVAEQGDTLRSIAARVFGDSTLWYIIAQANGLPDPTVQPGTTLTLPNRVVSLSNTSDSCKPFDLSKAIGDTTPVQPAPPPPKQGGCGLFGKILEIVVAAVVTYFSGGILGAVAGQLVAMADGDQKGFNWKS